MKRGKQTCKILKEIRRQIAKANDIEYITAECQYYGDCLGTCPKCEAEVRYLEEQLVQRKATGKAIVLFGVTTMMAITPGVHIQTLSAQEKAPVPNISIDLSLNTDPLSRTNDNKTNRNTEKADTCIVNPNDTICREEIPTIKTEEATPKNNDAFFGMVESMPTFPGGMAVLMNFLEKNTHYPDPDTDARISGSVIVQFTVKQDGSVGNAKILQSLHPLFDKEALRVINSMPKWIPGMRYGKKISVNYSLSITFNQK